MVLTAGEVGFVLRESFAGYLEPAGMELLATWSLGLALIASCCIVAVLPTVSSIMSQRRRLRGKAA